MDKYKAMVAFGPPGAGKGTACQQMKEFPWVHYIASGDVVREAEARNDRLGKAISSYLKKGKLIPDGNVIELVKKSLEERVEKGLYVPAKQLLICDGFPRTNIQRVRFSGFSGEINLGIEEVLLFDANLHVLNERRKDRIKEYENCGKSPRTDDTIDAFASRLADYVKTGNECLDGYASQGILITPIDANKSKEDVLRQVSKRFHLKAYQFGLA